MKAPGMEGADRPVLVWRKAHVVAFRLPDAFMAAPKGVQQEGERCWRTTELCR